MTRSDLTARLTEMLVDNVGREFPNLQEKNDLRADLGLDSVDMVTLLIEVQSQFRVIVPAEDMMNLNTVGSLLDYLQVKMVPMKAAA